MYLEVDNATKSYFWDNNKVNGLNTGKYFNYKGYLGHLTVSGEEICFKVIGNYELGRFYIIDDGTQRDNKTKYAFWFKGLNYPYIGTISQLKKQLVPNVINGKGGTCKNFLNDIIFLNQDCVITEFDLNVFLGID